MTNRNAYQRQYQAANRGKLNAQRRARRKAKQDGKNVNSELTVSKPSSPTAIANWIQRTLIIPTPPRLGQPMTLAPWQRKFIQCALKPGVAEAGLSIGRRNAKTYTIAAIALAHLVGPANAEQWRGAVVSLTAGHAREFIDAAELLAEKSGLEITARRSPYPGKIIGQRGAELLALSADKGSGHSIGLDLAVFDELGLTSEADRPLLNAMSSARGGRDGKLIALSVLGDSPLFREMRTRITEGKVPGYWLEFSAPKGCKIDDEAAWHAANPGIKAGVKSLAHMRAAAAVAASSPSDQAFFRAYELNQPLDPTRDPIVSVSDWEANGGQQPEREGPCYAGLDLGGSTSQSAFVAYWPKSGRVECLVGFPAQPDLIARGERDGVGRAWQQMADEGVLRTYPGLAMDVAAFISDCIILLDGVTPRVVAADRYRWAELQDAIRKARAPWLLEPRGTGAHSFADGSQDVRAFQRAVLGRRFLHGDNLALERAVGESELRHDAAGNPALDKSRQRARIDALQAAVLAAGQAELLKAEWQRSETADEIPGYIKF